MNTTIGSNKVLVSIENVCVSYGANKVINNADLKLYNDDFVGIIGPNGGGKTTLIKCILGEVPYAGKIEYAPELNDRSRIGYLPQVSNFDRAFPISVRELILSGLQNRNKWRERYTAEEKHRAVDLTEMTGITHLTDRHIGELSGGELQRALLCRAVIADPMLLILDEPANFVDSDFERELYALLSELSKRMAVVVVSHDIGTISTVVKTIVCVNRTVHRHADEKLSTEMLENYNCPIQLLFHGEVPHTTLLKHK